MNEFHLKHLEDVRIKYRDFLGDSGLEYEKKTADGAGFVPIELDFQSLSRLMRDFGWKPVILAQCVLPSGLSRVYGFKDHNNVENEALRVYRIGRCLYLPNFAVDHFGEMLKIHREGVVG